MSHFFRLTNYCNVIHSLFVCLCQIRCWAQLWVSAAALSYCWFYLWDYAAPSRKFQSFLVSNDVIGSTEVAPILAVLINVLGILKIMPMVLVCRWRKFKERPVPNPSHSSVALWPPTSHEKVNSLKKKYRDYDLKYSNTACFLDTIKTKQKFMNLI